MRPLRPRPLPGARTAPAVVTVAASLILTGCTSAASDQASGPPRISPEPRPDIAAAMVEGRGPADERLNACELLDLTTERIMELTGADMPEVEPTGSGDLGLLCTYGGPGSLERYEMLLEESASASAEAEAQAEDEAESAAETTATSETAETTTTTTPTTTGSAGPDSESEPDRVPDTFAAGVVSPRGGPRAALAGQAAMLGARYACSEVRGDEAASIKGAAPAAPGAPAAVGPDLDTAYIDCVAAPTGGGVEVHTVLVSGDDLWHITLLQPETPRSVAAESSALTGLHRVARTILG